MAGSLLTEIEQPVGSELSESPQTELVFPFDPMMLLRFIFYVLVIIKIIEISFVNRRRRFSLRERIYRKFTVSYAELIHSFTVNDTLLMKITLQNTEKNGRVQFDPQTRRLRQTDKKVSFRTENNNYYDPDPTDDGLCKKEAQKVGDIKSERKIEGVVKDQQCQELNDQTSLLLPNHQTSTQNQVTVQVRAGINSTLELILD